MSAWLLNGLVAVPFTFAVLTWLLARRETAAVGLAVLGGLVTLGWSVAAVLVPGPDVDVPWIAQLGVRWHLGLDGISGPLVLMSTLVVALCLVSLVRHDPGCGEGLDESGGFS